MPPTTRALHNSSSSSASSSNCFLCTEQVNSHNPNSKLIAKPESGISDLLFRRVLALPSHIQNFIQSSSLRISNKIQFCTSCLALIFQIRDELDKLDKLEEGIAQRKNDIATKLRNRNFPTDDRNCPVHHLRNEITAELRSRPILPVLPRLPTPAARTIKNINASSSTKSKPCPRSKRKRLSTPSSKLIAPTEMNSTTDYYSNNPSFSDTEAEEQPDQFSPNTGQNDYVVQNPFEEIDSILAASTTSPSSNQELSTAAEIVKPEPELICPDIEQDEPESNLGEFNSLEQVLSDLDQLLDTNTAAADPSEYSEMYSNSDVGDENHLELGDIDIKIEHCSLYSEGRGGDSERESFFCGTCGEPFEDLEALLEHRSKVHISEPGPTHSPKPKRNYVKKATVRRCLSKLPTAKKSNLEVKLVPYAGRSERLSNRQPMYISGCTAHLVEKARKSKSKCSIASSEKPFHCPSCPKSFTAKNALQRHSSFHTGNRPHSCPFCPRRFQQRGQLRYHVKIHTDERTFACEVCPKKFFRNIDLLIHSRVHTGEKPFECAVCSKRLSTKPSLVGHMATHTGEKQFKCERCPRRFAMQQSLTRHVKVHEERPFVCEVCPKKFLRNSDLLIHSEVHTGEGLFECRECSKRYSTKPRLLDHMAVVHKGEKHYKCGHCPSSFFHRQSLVRHVKIHTGHRPHACTYCEQAFIEKRSLKAHLRNYHPGRQEKVGRK